MKTRIAPAAAPPRPAVAARVVGLAAALCFGQPGQNACLTAKEPRGWEGVLPRPGTTHPAVTRIPQAPSCN